MITDAIQQVLFERSIPEPNTGCWLWLGGLWVSGYGRIRRKGKETSAHRYVAELHFGLNEIKGLEVLHRCDQPSCVNPEHLFLGTSQDNTIDMFKKHRAPIGKVSEEQVRFARQSILPVKQIAQAIGLGLTSTYAIRAGESWKWIR